MAKKDYNLIVIGAGSAGLVSAFIGSVIKAKVALIEKHKMGGDCLNTGCVPSKALIRTGKILSYIKRSRDFGLKSAQVDFEFRDVMERVQNVIQKVEPHDSIERYTKLGVDCYTGSAKIISPHEVQVNGQTLTTKNIIIATGARPAVPPIPGLDQVDFLTTDTLWNLRELPKKLVVAGGGPIGCELAQCFARLGSEVTVVEMLPDILIREDEEAGNTPPVIVIGYDLWQTRYGADPDIIGKTVRANGRTTTVVGVMPDGFKFPFDNDVWLPLGIDRDRLQRGDGPTFSVIGRLQETATLDQARAQMSGIAAGLAAEFPATNDNVGVFAHPYVEEIMPPQITAILYIMLGAVFGVLLIACANVANLLLARAVIRSKEVAIRSALGASRSRLIRQLLVEAAILAITGGFVGIALGYVATDVFNAAILDIQKPYWIDIRLDTPVLFFALGITMLASLVSGTVPAFKATGADIQQILNDETRGSSSFRMGRFSTGLVIGEIALSCALLVAAGFMIKSVVNLRTLDMGFETAGVFTARIGLFEPFVRHGFRCSKAPTAPRFRRIGENTVHRGGRRIG
ncbi:MAG: FAD-dependent oxidoreductase [Proteobacteria bacterium]|nr:FAD-dependent oxidoreductase [Pseudomonadota bacterium]